MSARHGANGRTFQFDLAVEIAPGLGISGGELAELIADGLLVLEGKNILFPGLRLPGQDNWLLSTSLQCTGYARSPGEHAVDMAYTRLMAPSRPRKPKETAKLAADLQEAGEEVGAAILRLRMLQARLAGLADVLATSPAVATEVAKAGPLLQKATANILATVESELAHLL